MVQLKDSLDKITVYEFIACTIHKDMQVLVISGEPTPEELEACALKLASDHHAALPFSSMNDYVKKSSRISYLSARVQVIESAVNGIRQALLLIAGATNTEALFAELAPLLDQLRYFKHNLQYTPKTIERDLQAVITGEKRNVTELIRLNAALKATGDKKEYSPQEAEKNFYLQLKEIRKFEKYDKPPRELAKIMTMADYGEALQSLVEHNELMKKQPQHEQQ